MLFKFFRQLHVWDALLALMALAVLLCLLYPAPARAADLARTASLYEGARAAQLGLPRSLWCADFANFVLRRVGLPGTGSREARSFAHWGRRLSGPRPGAIAVFSRRGGGHVGFIESVEGRYVVLVSGNSRGGRVARAAYPRSRLLAVVAP